jgi:hypothetical protein
MEHPEVLSQLAAASSLSCGAPAPFGRSCPLKPVAAGEVASAEAYLSRQDERDYSFSSDCYEWWNCQ